MGTIQVGTIQVPLRESSCGECGATVPDDATRCPGCYQTTGPFNPLQAVGHVTVNDEGQAWLCTAVTDGDGSPRRASREYRPLSPEAARWVERYATWAWGGWSEWTM